MIRFIAAAVFLSLPFAGLSDPLTRNVEINFGRDVSSRNLKGLATRSDGRVLPGPVVTELGPLSADLAWTFEAVSPNRWLVGTGPEAKVIEVVSDGSSFSAEEIVDFDQKQVFALASIDEHRFLAGTSPGGWLHLVEHGEIRSSVRLPADSIWDIVGLPVEDGSSEEFLVATGNPGRIYHVNLAQFSQAGVQSEGDELAEAPSDGSGVKLWAEVRDRNIRSLVVAGPDRILAGSAPRGTLYAFSREGGSPFVLYESREGEITDLIAFPNGDVFASLVYNSSSPDRRLTRTLSTRDERAPGLLSLAGSPASPEPLSLGAEFSGRSEVILFPADGFPRTVVAKNGQSFYALGRLGNDTLLIGGGEKGDLLGYDIRQDLTLTYPGTASAQVTGILPFPDRQGRFLLLSNNIAALAALDFNGENGRELITDRIDLRQASELGALRFGRLAGIDPADLEVSLQVGNTADENDGWSPWIPAVEEQGGFQASLPRARYVKVKLAPAGASPFQIGKAVLFHRAQNRAPVLNDFKILPSDIALLRVPDAPPPPVVALGQILLPEKSSGKDETMSDRRSNSFYSSQLISQEKAQVVLWSAVDPDGDALRATLRMKHEEDAEWTELARNISETFVQFDTSHLRDGRYLLELILSETSPRPQGERLSIHYESDELILDSTAPEIVSAEAALRDGRLLVTVAGQDDVSLLQGMELAFNNGHVEQAQHPLDGILDSRHETFSAAVPLSRIAGSSSLEVYLRDQRGNSAVRRLPLTLPGQ